MYMFLETNPEMLAVIADALALKESALAEKCNTIADKYLEARDTSKEEALYAALSAARAQLAKTHTVTLLIAAALAQADVQQLAIDQHRQTLSAEEADKEVYGDTLADLAKEYEAQLRKQQRNNEEGADNEDKQA